MGAPDERKPLIEARGVLNIDEFRRSTGLDAATVERLVMDGSVEGVSDLAGQVVGLFDDALPTAEELRSMGVQVNHDYDPNALRSNESDIDDEVETGNGGPSWTMFWGDRDA
jgi:hypothetical protein